MTYTSLPKIMRTIDDIARFPSIDREFIEESRKYWYYKRMVFDEHESEKARKEYPLMSQFKNLKDFIKWYSTMMYKKLKEAFLKGDVDQKSKKTIDRLFNLYSLSAPGDITIFPIVESKVDGWLINGNGMRNVEVIKPEVILPNGVKITLSDKK